MGYITSNLLREFNCLFNTFKEPVTINSITTTRDSEGNITETKTATNTYALIEFFTETTSDERLGQVEAGDAIAIVTGDTQVKEGDEFVIHNVTYEVKTVTHTSVRGQIIYKECHLRKKQ